MKNRNIIKFLLVLGLALPNFCFAQFDVAGAIGSVFAKLFGLIANILATITGAFLGAAVSIFNWVFSEGFISLSYTNAGLSPGDPHFNPFLYTGWTLTRDLTNIFFILALIVIGLATALRFRDYEAKKALPILVIIALLINFTPVILGLIVDAANIVMNFFVQEGFASGNSIANFALRQWDNPVFFNVSDQDFWDPMANVAAAAGSIALIFFNAIAGLIYLIFAFVFIVRYVAIWTLVILSPFAFASYILPATRKIFSQWWQQFIQWSLVGAIAAFFLYLGDHFINATTGKGFVAGQMAEVTNAQGFASIMNSILPQFVAIVFLFIGLFASLTFAPKGANAIIQAGQRGGKAAGKVTGKWSWTATKATGKAAGRTATAVPRSFAQGVREGGGWRRRGGWARGFRRAGKTLTPPPPKQWGPLAKGYAKYRIKPTAAAAGRGLKGAAREIWKAVIKTKKGRKLTPAEIAAREIAIEEKEETPPPLPPSPPSPPQSLRTPRTPRTPTVPTPSTSSEAEKLRKRRKMMKRETKAKVAKFKK